VPADFETATRWRDRSPPWPKYWNYVKVGACHALVRFNLLLAQRAEPEYPFRIIASPRHSTVWDPHGGLMFEFCYLAVGIPPATCYKRARRIDGDTRLPINPPKLFSKR
jgi:hypothetical protein